MVSKSSHIRASISAILEPALLAAGYTLDYPNYRRQNGDTVHLLEIQYWKHGGGFLIEMASQTGPFKDWSGAELSHEELTTSHTDPMGRARLGPEKKVGRMRGFFRFDTIQDDPEATDSLMRTVTGMLPQIEAWFASGDFGPNIS